MPSGQHSVTCEGVDISCLVEQAAITHGRDGPGGQPEASSCTLDLNLSADPLPAVVDVGALVVVTTTTPNVASTRFQGKVTDLHLGWADAGQDTPDAGMGQLVAIGTLADLGRRVVGDAPFPQELDGARVARVTQLAGVVLDPAHSDPGTVQILARDIDSQPALDVAQAAAQSASGILWQTRAGEIRYADAVHRRGIPSSLALDACDLLVTPTWRRNTEGLVNSVSIGYGVAPDGGEQPRYVDSRQDSIDKLRGTYGYTTTSELAALADAQALGQMLLVRNGFPVWVLAALPIATAELDQARYDQLLGLDMHALVTLTGLPAVGTAPTTASLWVEGWNETLSYGTHELELVVSGYCRTAPAPRWDDVDPGWTWDSARPGAVDRTNLAGNPIGPVGTAVGWWIPSRATAAVSGDALRFTINDANTATLAQRINAPSPAPPFNAGQVPAVPGKRYTISADMRANTAAGGGVGGSWYDAAGVLISAIGSTVNTPLDAATYTRVTFTTSVAPAGTAWMYPQIGLVAGARNIGEWFDVRRVLIEEGAAAGAYFDGSTPDTATDDYAWTAAVNASASTHRPIDQDTANGLPPDLTWDGITCLGPPINYGRWNDQPASLRWDQVPATTTWDTYTGV